MIDSFSGDIYKQLTGYLHVSVSEMAYQWMLPFRLQPYRSILLHRSYCKDMFYKFHHKQPFRKEVPKSTGAAPQTLVTGLSTDPNENYCLLYSSKFKEGINIYAYIHPNPKAASRAKGLKCDARLVSYGAIAGDPKETIKYVSSDDVHIYTPYVRSLDIESAITDYLM